MLYKILAIQIAWLGCLSIYCAARQQLLLTTRLPWRMAWVLFVVAAGISLALLCQVFHPLTASIFVLCVWMLAWVLLALCLPYARNTNVIVPLGSLLFLLTSLLGGVHVV